MRERYGVSAVMIGGGDAGARIVERLAGR